MKTASLTFLLFLVIHYAFGQQTKSNENKAVFQWKTEEIDLGKIKQYEPVSAIFKFTNNGSVPLVITHVTRSCGCIASEYPNEPIFSGKTSTITATYDAKALGAFDKQVTVFSNTGEPVILRIKGEVIPN